MAENYAKLQRIEQNEAITKETHYEFYYQMQRAMLLALRERGRLSVMQQRHAEEKLKQKRQNRAKRMLEKGERR